MFGITIIERQDLPTENFNSTYLEIYRSKSIFDVSKKSISEKKIEHSNNRLLIFKLMKSVE
jgi:hypothetical protein